MIDHVAAACRAVAESLLVSVRDDSVDYAVEDAIQVVDRVQGAGPLAGLEAGMSAAQSCWLLVLACDMPLIDTATMRTLVVARTRGVAAVIARTPDQRIHPLCACYHVSILPRVREQLAARRYSVTELVECLECVRYVDVPYEPLTNVNVSSDLAVSCGDPAHSKS